ncbi:MAG: hypothetical protein K6F95_04925 [Selenomonas sp.]|uniref:hypothetical protein n=1 Tax=Selenomonas sp. TaxID=2053611 RepID=UPI0025F03A04|nr:hypothetical protein [Selenomonas sp.]MCR5757231.1 hypothetical protein [Selenomonas sp.]
MGSLFLLGAGIFIGWLVFRPKTKEKTAGKSAASSMPTAERIEARGKTPTAGIKRHVLTGEKNDHTFRNVAAGVAAGTVLGHMLSSDHRAEAHETINNYHLYHEYDGQDGWDGDEQDYADYAMDYEAEADDGYADEQDGDYELNDDYVDDIDDDSSFDDDGGDW